MANEDDGRESGGVTAMDLASADDPRAVAGCCGSSGCTSSRRCPASPTGRTWRRRCGSRRCSPRPRGRAAGEHPAAHPAEVDPPKHVKYRRILDPLFAPKHMALLDGRGGRTGQQTMDNFAAKGSCDFHEEFAVPLPCTVFLRLMGLPLEDLDLFLAMKDGIIRPPGDTMEDQEPVRRETADEHLRVLREDPGRAAPGRPPRTCWPGSCGPRSTG